jgi:hypothetical protein
MSIGASTVLCTMSKVLETWWQVLILKYVQENTVLEGFCHLLFLSSLIVFGSRHVMLDFSTS